MLTEITIPTVRANWAAWKVQAQRCTAERESPPARFFSGDWMMFMELLSAQEMCGTYDMVLTSETIYSLDSMHSLVTCIRRVRISDCAMPMCPVPAFLGLSL